MEIDEMIAVLTAHKTGKETIRRQKGGSVWLNNPNSHFDFVTYDYRIKIDPVTPNVNWNDVNSRFNHIFISGDLVYFRELKTSKYGEVTIPLEMIGKVVNWFDGVNVFTAVESMVSRGDPQ